MAEIFEFFVMGVGVGVDETLKTGKGKKTVMISLLVQGLVKVADFGSGKKEFIIHLHFSHHFWSPPNFS